YAARVALADGEAGAREQPGVVGDVVSLNIAAEKVTRERAIAADLGERRLRVGDRVRTVDVAFTAAPGLAVLAPHRLHEVIERETAVGPIAQRQIERER